MSVSNLEREPEQVVLAPLRARFVVWVGVVGLVLALLCCAEGQLRALFLFNDATLLLVLLVSLAAYRKRRLSFINPWILVALTIGTLGWGVMALISPWLYR